MGQAVLFWVGEYSYSFFFLPFFTKKGGGGMGEHLRATKQGQIMHLHKSPKFSKVLKTYNL